MFCQLPEAMIAALLAQGFQFYHGRWATGVARLVTSFATRPEQVDALLAAARPGQPMQLLPTAKK